MTISRKPVLQGAVVAAGTVAAFVPDKGEQLGELCA